MVSAGLPTVGVMVSLEHVLTTPPQSTLMTLPYVETPHSGEDCLVTITDMEYMHHCPGLAGDVTAPCKHVPIFGILGTVDIRVGRKLNISPGPGAKMARTRSLD